MEQPVQDLLAFLRFPSISTDPARARDVADCADWLAQKLKSIGLNAEIYPTSRHPIVVAKNQHVTGRPTVLIYGHYDVQPVDPVELWTSPPFDPRIENEIIIARGAADNKGQILAHVMGVAASIAEHGDLPVNVIFVIEGEEEIGSSHLEEFLRQNAESLRCDVIVISDTGMVAPDRPTLTYALRGIAALEIELTGPSIDLHSGIYGGAVTNPITALARMIATFHDEHGRVAVKGFYDGVCELEKWERDSWKQVPINEESLRQLTGVPELAGETGYAPLERMWARPTVELNGIGGGYQGEGSKTVIPSRAFAKLTMRLVPEQKPADVLEKVEAHLRGVCPPSVSMRLSGGHSGEPFLCDPHGHWGKAAQRALREAFHGTEPVLIREGGSIPIVTMMRDLFKTDVLLLGLALPDCRAHSPNENFPLANFWAGIRLNRILLEQIGREGVRR
jgi:acetylornithine deacetylase/succinyl-diaminopimelate desuccinylase-like protein